MPSSNTTSNPPAQSTPNTIAIIGAGLSSLSLCLTLLHFHLYSPQNITIYESRSPSAHSASPENSSGIILTPNGLSVLRSLSVYDRIEGRCWKSAYRTYKDDSDKTTRKVLVANEELYGFRGGNHRCWRRVLLDELKRMVVEDRRVRVRYGERFEGVVREDEDGVTFLVDGKEERAGMLVGGDGIYSSVRKWLQPDVQPEYTGVMAVLSHIRYDDVQWPYDGYEKQFTIQSKPGAVFMIPEDAEGEVGMVGLQKKMEGLGKKEWQAMVGDREKAVEFYCEKYEQWGETSRKIIDAVCRNKETLYMWPFLRMPKLQSWSSEGGRVLLVGDAAHAVPPSSGQGVNQALEDVWSLCLLLKSGRNLKKCLTFWQSIREKRMESVFEWATGKTNVMRLPEEDRQKLMKERNATENDVAEFDDMRWLYISPHEQEIEDWLKGSDEMLRN